MTVAGAITIRRATPADAPLVSLIMGDSSVYAGTLQLPYPNEERHRSWLTEISTPGKTDIMLLAERDGAVVGSAGLHPAGPSIRRRHAVYLGITVIGAAQGQGVGRALMAAVCDYADCWLGVLRIELTVFADNARAIALYRRFGFEVEGTLRAYALRDGQYVDALAMARLHPNPPTLTP